MKIAILLCLLSAVGAAGSLTAQAAKSGSAQERLLPERFLREYDPVTLYFTEDRGPRSGGPADDASSLLSISPAQSGEYRWLDARTLQFLPAESWPALKTFGFKTKSGSYTRSTLMSAPIEVSPPHLSRNLAGLSSITLGFATPLDLDTLAEMLSLESRPLPGLGSQAPTRLTRKDFSLKELERKDRRSPARYLLSLASPIGDGRAVSLRVKLSLDEGIPGSVAVYEYTTRTDFRVLSFGSGSVSYPVSSSGSSYPADQAVASPSGSAPLFVQFSEAISKDVGLTQLRSMLSFEPEVRNLRLEPSGPRLMIYFDRDPDTDYRLTLKHAAIASASGRVLSPFAPSSFHFYSRAQSSYIQWRGAQAILERDGPQSLPLEGRGVDKLDLRVYAIDPLDLNYWPFPDSPVKVEESSAPPMPGEEPAAGTALAKQLRLLGSPGYSEVVGLAAKEKGSAARFGLDLGPALRKLGREGKAGSYLVGYRRLGADSSRSYMRVQVTDLCLSTVEEARGLVFAVTSFSTGRPVPGASISLDALERREDGSVAAKSLVSGITDKEGRFAYRHEKPLEEEVSRVVVSFGEDKLVLDTSQAPPYFHDNHWFGPQSRWLGWLTMPRRDEDLSPRHLAYLFTERPIYRAEEAVHIQGFVRARAKGLIAADSFSAKRSLSVVSPDGKEFRYKVELKGSGYFYQLFDEKDLPTGSYTATLLDERDSPLAQLSFKKEAYRIPSFELQLSGPDRVPFDSPFKIELAASYYAGGRVAGQSVEWSVSEGPWAIAPAAYEDYAFSSYLSVGGEYSEEGVSANESQETTDGDGLASISIDPRTAQSIQSRYYKIQASVRGADEQTVSATKTVLALPPFSIGVKLPRFETDAMAVRGSAVVLDHLEKPIAGKALKLKLYERQWHSYLSESDITTGQAKYVSDVVDEPVLERDLVSAAGPTPIDIPVAEAGVYILEIQGRDAQGRLQSVKRDLYVSGPTPVAWKRTTAAVFETSLDKRSYEPGESAKLLIQSPFQSAQALVVVERPSGNLYQWSQVKDGQGMLSLPVTEDLVPRFPVHIVLMRGRLPGSPSYEGGVDRLKPLSVANTTWINVDPSSNRVELRLYHPATAAPGTEVSIDLSLVDRDGKPVDGSVALWLVDRAVLALAKERFASPLSSFITDVKSAVSISDTRNLGVGNLPFEELAGGDMAEASLFGALLDKDTVRKNFKTVPYFNPAVSVKNGRGRVSFTLPDNLTEFAVRAIATSGVDKFGVAKSILPVRLPVVVQEALPRFFRPGDKASVGGIARAVDGVGGAAQAELSLDGGLLLKGGGTSERLKTSLDPKLPTRLYFPVEAPLSLASEAETRASIALGIGRLSDGAKDAFSISLPIRSDSEARRIESTLLPKLGEEVSFPFPKEAARPGSTVQTLYLVSQPEIVQLLRCLRFQASYPYGCTEQRIAKAHPLVALSAAFGAAGLPEEMRLPDSYMSYLLEYLATAIAPSGLYAFYPGQEGRVYLTSYVVEFLSLAKGSGYKIPDALLEKPVKALKEALRSDYELLAQGYEYLERGLALCALDAAGYYDPAYGQELLSLAQDADAYTQARIWLCLNGKRGLSGSQLSRLRDSVLKSVAFRKDSSGLVAIGLQRKGSWFGNPFLYSDFKAMAAVYSVYVKDRPKAAETRAILDYLVAGAGADGWGDTYTNSCVLASIAEALKSGPRDKSAVAELWDGRAWKSLKLGDKLVARLSLRADAPLKARLKGMDGRNPPRLLLETSFYPAEPGSRQRADNQGFAVSRELLDYGQGGKLERRMPAIAALSVELAPGSVVEDHVRVVNAESRGFVAVRVPLAAGLEPLNPRLETAPKEAMPAGSLTRAPSYADYRDDQVIFYYDSLPAGTYDFYFRARASFEGVYVLPPAVAQELYNLKVRGSSDGAWLSVAKEEGDK